MRDWFSNLRLSGLRLSISARLTLWFGCSTLLLLGLFGTYLYVSFHVGLHRDLGAALEREKAHLLATAEGSGEGAEARLMHHHATGPGTYVRVFAPDGHVQARSANFQGRGDLASALPETPVEETVTRHWGEAHARSLYTPLRDPTGALSGWLEITRLESQLHRELHRLGWLLVLGGLLGTGVALAAGYGLARRALRPVSRLTEAAKQIQREGFGRRLPTREDTARDELTDLADAFNDMLERLEASFERERRFRADAAHQLLTPLSAMQSEAEVTLRKQRDPQAYEESLQRILKRSRNMGNLVGDLLQLSHAERDPPSENPRPIQLGTVTSEVAGQLAPRAEAKRLHLETALASQVEVRATGEALRVIAENLLSNAVKYTPEGGTVTARVFEEAGEAILEVRDTGVGFAPEKAGRLFDRFHRGVEGPSDEAGTGLGLSIARALAQQHGGTLTAHSEGQGKGSTFQLRMPRMR